ARVVSVQGSQHRPLSPASVPALSGLPGGLISDRKRVTIDAELESIIPDEHSEGTILADSSGDVSFAWQDEVLQPADVQPRPWQPHHTCAGPLAEVPDEDGLDESRVSLMSAVYLEEQERIRRLEQEVSYLMSRVRVEEVKQDRGTDWCAMYIARNDEVQRTNAVNAELQKLAEVSARKAEQAEVAQAELRAQLAEAHRRLGEKEKEDQVMRALASSSTSTSSSTRPPVSPSSSSRLALAPAVRPSGAVWPVKRVGLFVPTLSKSASDTDSVLAEQDRLHFANGTPWSPPGGPVMSIYAFLLCGSCCRRRCCPCCCCFRHQ
ncbi:unnamed protein product, partial [Polarella glacialis]